MLTPSLSANDRNPPTPAATPLAHLTAALPDRPVAVIFTALKLEAKAVLAHIAGIRWYQHKNTVFDCGIFVAGNATWHVALVECGPGNISVPGFVHAAAACFDPDIMLFVGIAGGIKDVELGDVVAASKVYAIHGGKAGADFLPRADIHHAD